MVFIDVPTYLVGHYTDVIAINPIFQRLVVFKIVFVSTRKNSPPERLQISGFFLGNQFTILKPITGSSKLYSMLNAHHGKKALCRICTYIEVLLVVVDAFSI